MTPINTSDITGGIGGHGLRVWDAAPTTAHFADYRLVAAANLSKNSSEQGAQSRAALRGGQRVRRGRTAYTWQALELLGRHMLPGPRVDQ